MPETILITGGSGFLGLLLARDLIAEGKRIVVFDLKSPDSLMRAWADRVIYRRGDITDFSQVLNAVRDCSVEGIIHLAALLSEPSEANPWASINVNAMGAYHVLEAARLFGVKKVLITSSLAVYVNNLCKFDVITEETLQRPQIIYGVTKVFTELLGLYYQRKFALDVRGIRLPVIIGPNVESPGFGQYHSQLIQSAVLGRPFEVKVPEDTAVPLLYVKDAVASLRTLFHASAEGLVTRIYNVGQIMPPPTVGDVARTVRKHYPEAQITFRPDPVLTEVARNTPREIRCDEAREEWGWRVSYSLDEMVKDFIATFAENVDE
ncbi:MAG: NAD-dependent epimerase/dehydratase family protein [Deltaproteobacteria bacterium]|nr:NAD-dependent epimerase/dehydratase family protein [Deltaproteobacteria bacterium]